MRLKMKLNLSAFITTMKALTLLPLSSFSSCLCFVLVLSLCSTCFSNQNSDTILCIPTERLALIDLRLNLTDPANRLSSWVGKDCCTWSGVVCDNFTGHVHEIHLRGHCHESSLIETHNERVEASKQMLGGTINPSVIKLSQLRYLDLSCNNFGWNSIPAFIGSLQNLTHLNISQSNFSGEIPYQLGNLSTLQVLDLHGNYFYFLRSISLEWLKNLKGLRYLDMSYGIFAKAMDLFPVINNLTSLLELHLSSCGLNMLPSNATTVSNFMSLIVLDLSNNFFGNRFPGWIFSLRNLALLDLTDCYISGVILGTHDGFHNMPSLRTLRIGGNSFMNSTALLNGLSSLSNLRFLDVSISGISSPILGNLQNLSSIEYVDLLGNQIVEEIPKSFRNLCNFVTLNLRSNKFYGNASELLERFCECESPKLEVLDFGYNNLIGQLPERLGKLKNLLVIDLTNNTLNGSLPESIGRLSKLSSLSLQHNSFTGIVTKNHFSNLTALKKLLVGDNKLVFKLDVNSWIPPFKLDELRAGSCSLGPQFPSWLQSQSNLTVLDVSNANISDTIPNWIWTTFSNVQYFNISHNNIQGKLGNVTFLVPGASLDLSFNRLQGALPGNFSTDLTYLGLSNNNLSGSLQQFLCSRNQEPQKLYILNLANNNMSGIIPDCWMNWQSLVILHLEKNQFSGIIPSSLGNISSLLSLVMSYNRLSGNLPLWLLNSNSLVTLQLAENELTGKIPSIVGRNNTSLRILSLSSNKFEGKIPDEICHLSSLQILDLAHNDLSGKLPTCLTKFSVSESDARTLNFIQYQIMNTISSLTLEIRGNTYTYSTILHLVTLIDLSDNKFSGPIPDELLGLLGLRYLNLSHNDLTGTIPNLFSKTGKLELLDLSMNHLNGSIPSSLSQLTALNFLNLSYNNLQGRIPTGPQLQTFSELSFTGNALCGAPLPACNQDHDETLGNNVETGGTNGRHDGIDWTLVILTLFGLLLGFWIIVAPLFISRRWRNAYYHFLDEFWSKLQNLTLLMFRCLTKRFSSG